MNIPAIQCAKPGTSEYEKFSHSFENRQVEDEPKESLRASIGRFGIRPEFPLIVWDNSGHYEILDGQSRWQIAKKNNLEIYYIVVSAEDAKKDWVFMSSGAVSPWNTRDYVAREASKGKEDYREVKEFADNKNVPISYALVIHAGEESYDKVRIDVQDGSYIIKSREQADVIQDLWNHLITLSPKHLKNPRFLEALIYAITVERFSPQKMKEQAERYKSDIVTHRTKTDYVKMIDDIYSKGRPTRLEIYKDKRRVIGKSKKDKKPLKGGTNEPRQAKSKKVKQATERIPEPSF